MESVTPVVSSESGSVLAEFTAMIPLFLFLVFAMYEVQIFFLATESVHAIAREAGNLAFKHCIQKDLHKNPGASASVQDAEEYADWVASSSSCFNDITAGPNDYPVKILQLAERLYPGFTNPLTVQGGIIISVYDWDPTLGLWVRRSTGTLPEKYGVVYSSKLAPTYTNSDVVGVFSTLVYAEVFAKYTPPPTSLAGKLPGMKFVVPQELYRVTLM